MVPEMRSLIFINFKEKNKEVGSGPENLSTFAPHRGMEQLVARWAHNPKVTGSSPVPATPKPSEIQRVFCLHQVQQLSKIRLGTTIDHFACIHLGSFE